MHEIIISVMLTLMKKINNIYRKIRDYLKRRPKTIIPIVAFASLLIFAGVDCVRANLYLNSVDEYKNSGEILSVKDTVNQLQKSVKISSMSYFCDIELENLLAEFNEAYSDTYKENNNPETLMPVLHDQLKTAGSPPSFSSLMNFLPKPKVAEKLSQDINGAYLELTELSKENTVNNYCLNLESALVRIYFLQDLKKPEGVSALLPGQIDNFQTNVSQSQDLIVAMTFPTEFESEHLKILEFLNEVALDLRQDDNSYKQFARNIEDDLKILDEALTSIRAKTTKLQKVPDNIALQASVLE